MPKTLFILLPLLTLMISSIAFAADQFLDISQDRQAFSGKEVSITGVVSKLKDTGTKYKFRKVIFYLNNGKYQITVDYYLQDAKTEYNSSFTCTDNDKVNITGIFRASKYSDWLGRIEIKKPHPLNCQKNIPEEHLSSSLNEVSRVSSLAEDEDSLSKAKNQFKTTLSSDEALKIERLLDACADDIIKKTGNLPRSKVCGLAEKHNFSCRMCQHDFFRETMKYIYCLDMATSIIECNKEKEKKEECITKLKANTDLRTATFLKQKEDVCKQGLRNFLTDMKNKEEMKLNELLSKEKTASEGIPKNTDVTSGEVKLLEDLGEYKNLINYYLSSVQKSPRKEQMIRNAQEAYKKTGKPHFWLTHFSSKEMAKQGKPKMLLLTLAEKAKLNVDYYVPSFPENLLAHDPGKDVVVLIVIDVDNRGIGESVILKP